jgi:mRNA-degrading endonuclease RelE of RelBE toxin-antitoxin system
MRQMARGADHRLPGDGARGLRRLHRENEAAFAVAGSAIRALAGDPYPDGAVPWGDSGIWRLHAGDIRILYEVDEEKQAVYIINVGLVP